VLTVANSRTVVLDEIHVTVRVPADLPDDEVEAVRDTLADEFMAHLRRAVRAVVRAFPELPAARVSINR
jgi:2'-5' RNA ligase